MAATRTVAAASLVLALGLTGCGDDGPDHPAATTTRAPATTTATTTSTTTTTVTTTTTSAGGATTAPPGGGAGTPAPDGMSASSDPVPDGPNFGYVKSVSVGGSTITIDIADLLTGDAAVKAAIEDGAVEPGATSVDNDYYVRNRNPKLRTAPVASGATVNVLANVGSPDLVGGTLEQLGSHLATYGDSGVPVRIHVAGGTVTQLEEVYFP